MTRAAPAPRICSLEEFKASAGTLSSTTELLYGGTQRLIQRRPVPPIVNSKVFTGYGELKQSIVSFFFKKNNLPLD